MKAYILLMFMCIGLAGCATSPAGSGACSDLISGMGGLIRFCQINDKISASEGQALSSGVKNDIKIVDDPKTLAYLSNQINLNPQYKYSRRLVAHACVVKDTTYVSMRLTDIQRIVAQSRAP